MTLTPPPWLTLHHGSLKPSFDGHSWVVIFADEPQYVLTPIPTKGEHGVRVQQTISGKQLPCGKVYPSTHDALTGGLEELRQLLGW